MQHFGKAALRVTKNYTRGYSDTQAKVRAATSNDPWGPSGTQMNDIAQMTYNQSDFIEIMEMLDKRLNDKGKNWRHVFKSLTVLDYCLHQGSENVVIYFRDNIYVVKTLKEFQYLDEDGKDQGANVRQKAKDITNLLQDEARLRDERRARAHMRDRMNRGSGDDPVGEYGDENAQRRSASGSNPSANGLAGKRPNRDEDELRKAIEESKKSLAQDRATAEQRDLETAIRMSEEEEEKRKQQVANSNSSALFDDTNESPSPPSNNPFPLLDPTPYATGLQPQFTSIPQQYTSFNPYQQQAQEAAQAEFLQQQQLFLLQQQQAQQQAQQQQQQQQQQEEYMRQQQLLQLQQQQQQQQQLQQQQNLFAAQQNLFAPQQSLQLQPTGFGTNNPFAPSPSISPSNQTQQQRRPSPAFNLPSTYELHSPSHVSLSSSPAPVSHTPSIQQESQGRRPVNVKKKEDENETLAALFADKEGGQDTFGNIGALRYGYTDAGKAVVSSQTGSSHNPFALQQQNAEKPFFDI